MRNKIIELEKIVRSLEPSPAERTDWNHQVQCYADEFIDTIRQRPAFAETADKAIGLLDFPIQEEGRAMEKLLQIVKKEVDTPGLNPASGGHLAYIPGGGLFHAAVADLIGNSVNRYTTVWVAAPGLAGKPVVRIVTSACGSTIGWSS